ncbi:PAS domain S-box protein [Brevundimonas sp. SH203]|uniref:PAS domain S-box protein n=1 Tax=Brevundimonas sp. SH203 TaxID=345167 RepID=UPI000B3506EA|nr:PAS domain S-box protein [Brevundimonas sp. SH203]
MPKSRDDRASSWRMATADRWLVGLARLSTPSVFSRLVIGFGFAVAALLGRAALSTVYGDVTSFSILLPAISLAALAGGWTAAVTALIVCIGGGWAIVGLTATGKDGVLHAIAGVATVNFVVVGLFMAGISAALRGALLRISESDTRFRHLADTTPSPIWLRNADGAFEFVNAAVLNLHGMDKAALANGGWREVFHPDDLATIDAVEGEAAKDRKPYSFEARVSGPDGGWRWMRAVAQPRFDEQGRFLGHTGIAFDVTDSREALEASARAERRHAFLLDLTDRLRDQNDPDEIMGQVERALGGLLDAGRVGYGEVDQAAGVVSMTRDWTSGVSSAQGQFSLHAFGEDLIADLAEGRTIQIEDVRQDPRTAAFADAFDAIQTRALIRAPLIRGGRLRAFLYVHASEPRAWTEAQVSLVEEVAARTWAEVERARAENETRESEQRFHVIADTAPVLIWVTGQDGGRSFVNQTYVDFYGAGYEAARDLDWRAVIHPDDQARVLAESIAGEASHAPFSLEARYRRHDGQWRWLKSFSRPRLSGSEVIGFVGVAFDVTETRAAQAKLEESENRFRTVADSAPALIWMSDDAAQLVFANRRYRTFFDVKGEVHLPDSWRALVHPDDEAVFSAAFMRAFEARDRFEALSRVQHPSLGLRWLRTEGVPRFDASGLFQGYVGACLDVTDAKRAEDDLKRINELLEERVDEALIEKAQAEAQLMHAQRMEAVGRLTGGVAHDFNNLLTVVIGALDIILRSDDPAKRKKLGEAALAAARRGESLTHQLLAFSRRQALRPEPIDLNALIREGEPLWRRAVGETVDFKVRLKRGGARANVDPAQFEAALLNLIVNARDALGDVTGPKGRSGSRITVQTREVQVAAGDVAELTPGRYVCVAVIDNGEGMSPDILDRVFEPFFTTKGVGKGTGLGLSQVYGFARQSGGGVQIVSAPGQGAEIRLYLPPLSPEDAAGESAPVETDASLIEGGRLLLVEDDPGVAAVALEILAELGLDVDLAENGQDALRALDRTSYDMMLTDVVMPGGMSGVDLARAAARSWPEMRIALVSGYVGEDVDEVLADTPWPLLRKPYSSDQLRGLLEQMTAAPVA